MNVQVESKMKETLLRHIKKAGFKLSMQYRMTLVTFRLMSICLKCRQVVKNRFGLGR